jgi:hypothetical protein
MDTITAPDLSQFAGVFADGWTDDQIDGELPVIGQALGLELRCVWEYRDEYGCGGHSDLAVLADAQLRQIPDGLWSLLVEGDDAACIAAELPAGPHPDWPALSALVEVSERNLVVEDRDDDAEED